jgi:hypothetical protein
MGGKTVKRLFRFLVRWQACKMAALLMSGRNERSDEGVAPMIWSATVFFEVYMHEGADGTMADFGPKEPAELKSVANT